MGIIQHIYRLNDDMIINNHIIIYLRLITFLHYTLIHIIFHFLHELDLMFSKFINYLHIITYLVHIIHHFNISYHIHIIIHPINILFNHILQHICFRHLVYNIYLHNI